MTILVIGKRFYTNRDAFGERFGRIYQIPWHWASSGTPTQLWLIDYHHQGVQRRHDDALGVLSTPIFGWTALKRFAAEIGNRRSSAAIVVASGDCYIGLLGLLVARATGARFVFDVYDAYNTFKGYRSPPGVDLFDMLLRKADACLFASTALRDRLGPRTRASTLVRNGIDPRTFGVSIVPDRHRFALPEDTTLIGYFGSMEADRGIDDLLAAVNMLRARGVDLELVVAGHRTQDVNLCQAGIHDLGNLPPEAVPDAMGCCDLLALPYRRSSFLDMAASCKIAEYLAVRRPLVATRTPNLCANFPSVAQRLAGLLAEPSNPASLAIAIEAQINQRVLADVPGGVRWDEIAAALRTDLINFGIFRPKASAKN